jgi:hypothetical protein
MDGILKRYIPDVERNDRIFSDGIGTLSEDAVLTIGEHILQSKRAPTCFQIRYGGAKGMLTLDTRLNGSKIFLRPSMTKFQSDDVHHLELCDMASKPIELVLNRQMIKILKDMGVEEACFIGLQEKELGRIRAVTSSSYNVTKMLKRENVGEGISFPKLFCQIESLEYRKDPFLRSVVEAVMLKILRLVRYKARIPVDEGNTLFGVMDETGYLQEGEIYVTYDTLGYHAPPPGKRSVR